MQVKKFEARTMKEAIEMVKTQLGPDAVILSVRDNNKSFGLVGQGSVEITAAVSETSLHKKKFVESKLPIPNKELFQNTTAKNQKHIINKFVENQLKKPVSEPAKAILPKSNIRYIDILDDHLKTETPAVVGRYAQMEQKSSRMESDEIYALKSEIRSLKEIITQLKTLPQAHTAIYPGADHGLRHELSDLYQKLMNVGISEENTAHILVTAQKEIAASKLKSKSIVEGWVARYLLDVIRIEHDFSKNKFHGFIGPSGSGKTSMLVKLACHLLLREKKRVAIVTTDTEKVGSIEQLKIYTQILNVPFMAVRNTEDWQKLIRYSSGFDCILIDYAGNGMKTTDDLSHLSQKLPNSALEAKVHLVLSATTKNYDLNEMGKRYSVIKYHDVMFTHLDEATTHGGIFNFMHQNAIPLSAFGIGSRIPEDFEIASAERLLDLILKITQTQQMGAEAV